MKPDKRSANWIKWRQWEYWPAKAFYYPIVPYLLWLMLRARHLCFWSAANPGIHSGGMGLESKFETILKTPEAFRPKAALIPAGSAASDIRQRRKQAGLAFPLIAKPDLGFRGLLVRKVEGEAALLQYLKRYPTDFILQEYIDLPEEVGVLYQRFPGESRGRITSLTTKEFLSVTGDGKSTVETLIRGKPRALLQLPRIQEEQAGLLSAVPAAGERVGLGIVGNHAKGTRFINSNHLITDALCQAFDRIAQQVDGFYYGRFDLKCRSLEDLQQGRHFKIIEINGVCSEPTHIYDPQRGTYWAALRDIARHWRIIYRTARANRRQGVPYWSHSEAARAFLRLFAYQKQIKKWSAAGLP